MAKTLMQSVVKQLEKERSRLEDELHRVSAALTAFGKVYVREQRYREKANHVGGRTQENCSCAESALGKDSGNEVRTILSNVNAA